MEESTPSTPLKLTLEEVREVIQTYAGIPETPKGYDDPIAWESPAEGKYFIHSTIPLEAVRSIGGYEVKRLIINPKPKPKEYRYVTDGVLKRPEPGFYVFRPYTADKMILVTNPYMGTLELCYTREEIE